MAASSVLSFLNQLPTASALSISRQNLNSFRPSSNRLELRKRVRVASTSAILLPPAAGDNFRYGRQTTTSIIDIDLGHFLPSAATHQTTSTTTTAGVVGATLLQEQQLFAAQAVLKPIETPSEQEESVVELVAFIKQSLSGLTKTDGEVNVSAYDTAWVARIPHVDCAQRPQFPNTLTWIVENQHADGSWGDDLRDWLYDKMSQTLACVIALRSWEYCDDCVQRGLDYIKSYAEKLKDQVREKMPIGFELSFTAMLAEAKSLRLDLPYETEPFFEELNFLRQKKLDKVPLKLLHSQATTMLHNLEGIQSLDIDWKQLLKFQAEDGSICCSPSSTAVLYMHTGDQKCLSFLENALVKFNDAVPTVYPLDIFHNLWVVDTLERLGISRHFHDEIEQVLETVYRHWSDEHGICWARVLKDVPDLDDTSMAFRLLREHGYSVSAGAFKVFRKDNGFVCFAVGQMVQGVSDVYNLYRAAQSLYPGEKTLEDALAFSVDFLVDAISRKKGDSDKWCLKKDLEGEIEYSLKYPEYKNLKRMEIRSYLDKYGPEDAWIGKSIYRLRLVNNHNYLALAKADFNMCQALHQRELRQILTWISDSGLSDSRSVRERIVMFYVMFSAEVWEPELSGVRIAAAQCLFVVLALHQLYGHHSSFDHLHQVLHALRRWDPTLVDELPEKYQSCFTLLFSTLYNVTEESPYGMREDITRKFVNMWERLLEGFLVEVKWRASNTIPSLEDYWKVASTTIALEAAVWTSMLMSQAVTAQQFMASLDDSAPFIRRASESIRLSQGLADFKAGKSYGLEVPMFRSFFRDHEDATLEDAIQHFTSTRDVGRKDLIRERDQSTLPRACKRVVIAFTKVANFYYEGDYERESQCGLQRLLVNLVM